MNTDISRITPQQTTCLKKLLTRKNRVITKYKEQVVARNNIMYSMHLWLMETLLLSHENNKILVKLPPGGIWWYVNLGYNEQFKSENIVYKNFNLKYIAKHSSGHGLSVTIIYINIFAWRRLRK